MFNLLTPSYNNTTQLRICKDKTLKLYSIFGKKHPADFQQNIYLNKKQNTELNLINIMRKPTGWIPYTYQHISFINIPQNRVGFADEWGYSVC